jgi:uncharacterized protein (TIGR02246 family)
MMRSISSVGAVVVSIAMLAGGLHAQEPTNAELRRLADAYAQAWAKGDAKGLAGLHTTEAMRIGPDGKVVVGRAAIEQAMTEALTGPYRDTKIGLTTGQTTRVSQDVYASEGTFLVLGGLPPASSPTRGRYLNTIVRLNGRWLIASHATIPRPPPPK